MSDAAEHRGRNEVPANWTTVHNLRFEARCAHLDGRAKRAKELNRRADKMARGLKPEVVCFSS